MKPRWQLVSVKPRDLFDILKYPDAQTRLSTIELPRLTIYVRYGYLYETCYFKEDLDSEVLEQYYTQEEAEEGHERYRKQYNLI